MSPIPENSDLLTPGKTAELLGVSAGTLAVWRCTKRYALPYVKVGRLVRYERSGLAEFIASRIVTS